MLQLEKTLGLGAQLMDIERIRRALKQDKLVLVGHSFGAFLAALYAAEFPERVSALVLVSPATLLVVPQPRGSLFDSVRALLADDAQRNAFDALMKEYMDFGALFTRDEAALVGLSTRFGAFYVPAARARAIAGGLTDEDELSRLMPPAPAAPADGQSVSHPGS